MRQAGFSLIEALVAGMVSLVIPGVLIAVMSNSNEQISGAAADGRLSQIASAVTDEIHEAGLVATWVYNHAEAVGGKCPSADPVALQDLTGVIFCDTGKVIQRGFRIDGSGKLGSYDSLTGTWSHMVFAGDTVQILTNPAPYYQKAHGVFGIYPRGDFVWFNFRYAMRISGTYLTLPMQTQSVVCRNAPSRSPLSW